MVKAIRKIYDWTLNISAHKHATWGLAAVSFAESSFFPFPPDVVLIPMCVADRKRAFFYATICMVSSVIGGLAGYAIGYFLFDSIGAQIIHFYHYETAFENLKQKYAEWGMWLIIGKGLTPIPYKIVTITSGVLKFSLPVFIFSSIIARGMRFYLVAGLIWKYGAPIQGFIEKNLTPLAFLFLTLLIGGFVVLNYI